MLYEAMYPTAGGRAVPSAERAAGNAMARLTPRGEGPPDPGARQPTHILAGHGGQPPRSARWRSPSRFASRSRYRTRHD